MFDREETPKKEPVASAEAADSGDADTAAAAAAVEEAEAPASPAPAAAAAEATPATPAAASSSAPPSPTVTTPPMSPQRQLEARSADEMTTSVVRSLAFADTFLTTGKCRRQQGLFQACSPH